MSADTLIARLERVRRTGEGQWIARCPAHGDRTPSLAVRVLDDGRVLVHCFAECNTEEVLAKVGLGFSDLFPENPTSHRKRPERRPYNAHDILACVAHEAIIVALSASSMARGETLSDDMRKRLWLAASRLQAAERIANDDEY